MENIIDETRCAHCHRPFREAEPIWRNDMVGAICVPGSKNDCGATHVGPFRIAPSEWRTVHFGVAKQPLASC